jgi:hypothetical protein
MDSDEFLLTFPCCIIGDSATGRVATRLIEGEQAIVVFSDRDLADDYLEAVADLPPEFKPIEYDEPSFGQQLEVMTDTHRLVIVDLNHKTGLGRVFEVADLLARWNDPN